MVRPKKHLGQHFLTDRNIASQIAGSLKAADASCILEIGPGKGVLTEFLMQRTEIPLKLIEIDRESVVYLRENWPRLESGLTEGDFLKQDLAEYGSRLAIIGNFPYNISSQIFFRILDYRERVPEVVCMIQKEVAERIASPPGSKKYGILSVLLQAWYNIDILFHVNPGAFFPPPKVKSTVIRLTHNTRKDIGCSPELFRKIVKTAFNQRRKMMRNSLSAYFRETDGPNPYLTSRPEELGVDDFIFITNMVSNSGKPI